jgi:hypothetical protein
MLGAVKQAPTVTQDGNGVVSALVRVAAALANIPAANAATIHAVCFIGRLLVLVEGQNTPMNHGAGHSRSCSS